MSLRRGRPRHAPGAEGRQVRRDFIEAAKRAAVPMAIVLGLGVVALIGLMAKYDPGSAREGLIGSSPPAAESPAPTEPSPSGTESPPESPTAPAPCSPSGTTLSITAPQGASATGFDTDCLAAPAGQASTIDFDNADPGIPHNVTVYADESASERLGGAEGASDFITGPGSATYQVPALDPGTYFFRCDIHPSSMKGTFVVA